MEPASFLDVFVAVMCANGATALIIHYFLRMKRNENDHKANLGFLTILAFVGAILYASTTN